jgi:hypothetical protein
MWAPQYPRTWPKYEAFKRTVSWDFIWMNTVRQARCTVEVPAPSELIISSLCSMGSSDSTNLTRVWSLKMDYLTRLVRQHDYGTSTSTLMLKKQSHKIVYVAKCAWVRMIKTHLVRLRSLTGDHRIRCARCYHARLPFAVWNLKY